MHSSWHRVLIIPVLFAALTPALPAPAAAPPLKIAVFDFALEDVSAAGAASMGDAAADSTRMHAVTEEARRVLAQSGRFSIVDTNGIDARPCDGCDAAIGLKLGAERSLIGVVTRVAKTEYYVSLRFTDTGTGKVINEQSAFFTGADDAWASGVRMLLKHGILADEK
jgi:hypothetical protein